MAGSNDINVGGLNFLPNYYRTSANKKFLSSTIDQLTKSGVARKENGLIGRRTARDITADSNFVPSMNADRANYQLEPSIVYSDNHCNDYLDLIYQIKNFGGSVENHSRLFTEEFYSWDPRFNYDKFVNFQNYYWLENGPETVIINELDIESNIIGKIGYLIEPGVPLANGMKVQFIGNNIPTEYESKTFYVNGVGVSIFLIDTQTMLSNVEPEYVTISRGSSDGNQWSRSNKWFHLDVIETSARLAGVQTTDVQAFRARRPIIEFDHQLRLFNHGERSLTDVDLFDTSATNAMTYFEGSLGFYIDGTQVQSGDRVVFANDSDPVVKNKIYTVTYVTIGSQEFIHLDLSDTPIDNDSIRVRAGQTNKDRVFWFKNDVWGPSQNKTEKNQPPLFDVVDTDGVSFGDTSKYVGSLFSGTTIFEYKRSQNNNDAILGFPLTYLDVENSGDIVFSNTFFTDSFKYKIDITIVEKNIKDGYLITKSGDLMSLWVTGQATHTQAGVRIYYGSSQLNNFDLDLFDDQTNLDDLHIKVFLNGSFVNTDLWQLVDGPTYKQVELLSDISSTDVITIKTYAKQPINENGYYETPMVLNYNPLNDTPNLLTLGEIKEHFNSIVENLPSTLKENPLFSSLENYGPISMYGTRFIKHSGPIDISGYHLLVDDKNILDAMDNAKHGYAHFKNQFIETSLLIEYNGNIIEQVDEILRVLNQNKLTVEPYYFSDMVPFGSSVKHRYVVTNTSSKTYPLTQNFNLNTLSNQSVLIYKNDVQLLYSLDYVFDIGTVELRCDLTIDDIITIYEYDNTDGSFVPATPTKLGLWPKFEPKIFEDTTLVTPKVKIRGHDGSEILSYGDMRDDLILELEKRIYNNIKVEYDPKIFDCTIAVPGYFRDNDYSLAEYNQILANEYYKWIDLTQINETKFRGYDSNNPFTFNYVGYQLLDGTPLPGSWRGIYQYLYDTDTPHLTPWAMIGLTDKPEWWDTTYGPAPYTSDNLILWEDLSLGLVRDPAGSYVIDKYIRTGLLDMIPVNESGVLLDPITAKVVVKKSFDLEGVDFVFGDIGPTEKTWRTNSRFPFDCIKSLILLKPSQTLGTAFIRSEIYRDVTGRLVDINTNDQIRLSSINFPTQISNTLRPAFNGLANYILDHSMSTEDYARYLYDTKHLEIKLSHRLGGFTNKDKYKLVVKSKSATKQSSSFVPDENYSIILHKSKPVKRLSYSGIIISKLTNGYEISGYNREEPFFPVYRWEQPGFKINVGGISESFTDWAPNQYYLIGKVVKHGSKFYRVKETHTSQTVFDASKYVLLPELPVVGGRDALIRKIWDKSTIYHIPYKTTVTTVQEVVDIMLGYGEWLYDQGFRFESFNAEYNIIANWETSVKEFLFWTTQNWSAGQDKWQMWKPNMVVPYGSIVRYNSDLYRSLVTQDSDTFNTELYLKLDGLNNVGSAVISISPAAQRLSFMANGCVVDSDGQHTGVLLKVDGTPIEPKNLNRVNSNGLITYTVENDAFGIYGAEFPMVQYEQIVIVDNKTIFNETIFNLSSGVRQDTLKVIGHVSTEWDGSFNAPGFIFDRAIVTDWTPWKKYIAGDAVKYQQKYYSAIRSISGSEEFIPEQWSLLQGKPEPKLLPNWSYKAGQFCSFYDLDGDSFDSQQQAFAQHLIGYQKRQYLSNIIQNPTSEYKFYQGMITEKGTANVLDKLFGRTASTITSGLEFNEEWAIRTGDYGAVSAFDTIEFVLDESLHKSNPQGYELLNTYEKNKYDFIIRQTPNQVYLKPRDYQSAPFPAKSNTSMFLRSPGYARFDEAKLIVSNLTDLLAYNLDGVNYTSNSSVGTFRNGDYIWCGFERNEWNMYRLTSMPHKISSINRVNTDTTRQGYFLEVIVDRLLQLEVGQYVGLSQVEGINTFYTVESVSINRMTIYTTYPITEDLANDLESIVLFSLTSQRYDNIDNVDLPRRFKLKNGELLWTDDDGHGQWAIWEHANAYTTKEVYGSNGKTGFGKAIAATFSGRIAAILNDNNQITIIDRRMNGDFWTQRTIASLKLSIPTSQQKNAVMKWSSDERWLAVGFPEYQGVGRNGVVIVYEKDSANIIIKVAELYPPEGDLNGLFGSSLAITGSKLFIGAPGDNLVYRYHYDRQVLSTATYITNINLADDLHQISSIAGIRRGMYISGDGFELDQTVSGIYANRLMSANVATERFELAAHGLTNKTPIAFYSTGDITSLVTNKIYYVAYADENSFNVVDEYGSDNIVELHGTTSTVNVIYGDYITTFVNSLIFNDIPNEDRFIIRSNVAANYKPMTGTPLSFSSYIWSDTNLQLTPTNNILPGSDFGRVMELSKDETTLVVSSPNAVLATTTTGVISVYDSDLNLIDQLIGDSRGFGSSVAITDMGEYIAVGSPYSDGSNIDQGKILVYEFGNSYTLFQELSSVYPEKTEFFGSNIGFMNNGETLVSHSSGSDRIEYVIFDGGTTNFDVGSTFIVEKFKDSGRVDIFDRYGSKWIFGDSLANLTPISSGYGEGFAVSANTILVGSPYIKALNNSFGIVYAYSKPVGAMSWIKKHVGSRIPDVKKIKRAYLYNRKTNKFIVNLDVVDLAQGKIPSVIDDEIKYKTFYDPAVYSVSNIDDIKAQAQIAWADEQIGVLWWDLRTAKVTTSYDSDIAYRNVMTNVLFPGASIDIYEWVRSEYTPSEWDAISASDQGSVLGISGSSLYGDSVYSITKKYDQISGTFTDNYYFWVKNKTTVPSIYGRQYAANYISSIIENPRSKGYQFITLLSDNSFNLTNVQEYLDKDDIVLSLEYWLIDNVEQNIHSEWKLISSDKTSTIPEHIEEKWFDSLCGLDRNDRSVPDISLPLRIRYGIETAPRQSMFVNRYEALKQLFEHVNRKIKSIQINSGYDLRTLNSYEKPPSIYAGVYDVDVDTYEELDFTQYAAYRKPVLNPIVVEGRIAGITIVDGGRGFQTAPYIGIVGKGRDAVVRAVIDQNGSITGAIVYDSGIGYTTNTLCEIRNYAVLVNSDSNIYNGWSIYTYEPKTQKWSRTRVQTYDTRRYWDPIDWYEAGYNQYTLYDKSVLNLTELLTLNANVNDIVKVYNDGNGQWLLVEKTNDVDTNVWTDNYRVVGMQNGTIQFNQSIYNFKNSIYGYDAAPYDTIGYDSYASIELRQILTALKNDILIDDARSIYLDMFFASLRYILSEQPSVDWLMKTSYVTAKHNVGKLAQTSRYQPDVLSDYQDYLMEVKPYRTKIRKYSSAYSNLDQTNVVAGDFSFPMQIDNGTLRSVDLSVSGNEIVGADVGLLSAGQYKTWADNIGYVIQSIEIYDPGSGYVSTPEINITNEWGQSQNAVATIVGGELASITVTEPKIKFFKTPNIDIIGGLSNNGVAGIACAKMRTMGPRSCSITLKFDRTHKHYCVMNLGTIENFVGDGSQKIFPLIWPPNTSRGATVVKINDIEILSTKYEISQVIDRSQGYTKYSGKIVFEDAPDNNADITVEYKKNSSMLSAIDRINHFYKPVDNYGKDLAQLLNGFEPDILRVSGLDTAGYYGWGVGPYGVGGWCDFDYTNDDFIFVSNDGSSVIELPYIPYIGTNINVYHSKVKTTTIIGDITVGTNVVTNISSNDNLIVGALVFGSNIPSDTVIISFDSESILLSKNATATETIDLIINIGLYDEQRLDDINYGTSTPVSNIHAIMETWIADGVSNTITLPVDFVISIGDQFVLRRSTSDGTFTSHQTDYDTIFDGSHSGTPELTIDGSDEFTPDMCPSLEELAMCKFTDALFITIYDTEMTQKRMHFKDMYDRNHYKIVTTETQLAAELTNVSTTVTLVDASGFFEPDIDKNKPGVIYVAGERIEYFEKSGNVLNQLRRGTLGTSPKNVCSIGTVVYDIGPDASAMYGDSVILTQVESTGSKDIWLPYAPSKSTVEWNFMDGFQSAISDEYGQADDIEVIIGGNNIQNWSPNTEYTINQLVRNGVTIYRCVVSHISRPTFVGTNWVLFAGNVKLSKTPYIRPSIDAAPYSPEGDVQFDADFYVDGANPMVKLTNAVDPGILVTVLRKTGHFWNPKFE